MGSAAARKLAALLTVLLLLGGCDASSEHVWRYQYRDEGGNAILVTPKFDLVLPGRQWHEDDTGFVAGGSVLVVDGPLFDHVTSTSLLQPTPKEGGRLELSLPDQKVTIVRGNSVEIGDETIPLPEDDRVLITIAEDDAVTASDPPASKHTWSSVEYIQGLAEKFRTEQSAAGNGEEYADS